MCVHICMQVKWSLHIRDRRNGNKFAYFVDKYGRKINLRGVGYVLKMNQYWCISNKYCSLCVGRLNIT